VWQIQRHQVDGLLVVVLVFTFLLELAQVVLVVEHLQIILEMEVVELMALAAVDQVEHRADKVVLVL
tara:strand:- start:623 stop:823 length:201 start_codon:yes stop_codon:yes gene_type:complete